MTSVELRNGNDRKESEQFERWQQNIQIQYSEIFHSIMKDVELDKCDKHKIKEPNYDNEDGLDAIRLMFQRANNDHIEENDVVNQVGSFERWQQNTHAKYADIFKFHFQYESLGGTKKLNCQ